MWEAIIGALITALCLLFALREIAGWTLRLPILGLIALGAYLWAKRTRRAKFHMTSLECVTQSNSINGYYSGKTVLTADIRWLEYRQEQASESSTEPEGLFAVTRTGERCLIPFVSYEQSSELISVIEGQFPAFAEKWRTESPFGEHFTTLSAPKPH